MPRQLPLTFQQRWLRDLIQQHAGWRCILTNVLRLSGALDPQRLCASINQAMSRHDALRTCIVASGDTGVQEIDESCTARVALIEIGDVAPSEIEQKVHRALESFADGRLDPAVTPLVAFGLIKVHPAEHLLVMTIHRLIADCIGADLVLTDICMLYHAIQGQSHSTPQGPQYSDYAQWQNRSYAGWLGKHEAYWIKHLAGTAPIQWPTSRPRSHARRGDIGRVRCQLDAQLSDELREAARRLHTLAATFMLSIYLAVLAKWCRQRDLVIPFNIAGRQSEHKNVVGYFSHVLYLRFALSGNETFAQLLDRVANEFFQSLSHQDFGSIAMRWPALLEGTFFQWITWHKSAFYVTENRDPADVAPLTTERFPFREFGEGLTAIPPGMVDVEMTFIDTEDGIHALGVYRADRFSSHVMEEFLQTFQLAVQKFVRDPHSSIAT